MTSEPPEPSSTWLLTMTLGSRALTDPLETAGGAGQSMSRLSSRIGSGEIDQVRPPSVEWTMEADVELETA